MLNKMQHLKTYKPRMSYFNDYYNLNEYFGISLYARLETALTVMFTILKNIVH